eukprot:scaffold595_cov75-Skeletonema_marinoi.AAC.2
MELQRPISKGDHKSQESFWLKRAKGKEGTSVAADKSYANRLGPRGPMNSAISAGRLHRARRGSLVRLPRICRRRSVQTEPQQSIDSEDSDYETEEEEQHTPPSPVLRSRD